MNVLVTGGSGYVGSVLVPELAKTHKVRVLETMNFGNPIEGIDVEFIKGDITESRDVWAAVRGMDAVIICVPTPLNKNSEPDISYVLKTGEAIAPFLSRGMLVALESTTYPGTTDEDVR